VIESGGIKIRFEIRAGCAGANHRQQEREFSSETSEESCIRHNSFNAAQ
jgi:hypothetical protein